MKIQGHMIQQEIKPGLDLDFIQTHFHARMASILKHSFNGNKTEVEYRLDIQDIWATHDYQCKVLIRINKAEVWMIASNGITAISALSKSFDHIEDLICSPNLSAPEKTYVQNHSTEAA